MRSVLTFLFVLSFGYLTALPLDNPLNPSLFCNGATPSCLHPSVLDCEWLSLRFGFSGNYVNNRRMELDTSEHDSLQQASITTNAGVVTLNVCNRLDVYARLGASNIFLQGPLNSFTTTFLGNQTSVISDTDFSYGIGAQAVLLKHGPFAFGAQGEYFYTNPRVNSAIINSASNIIIPPGVVLNYREWQVSGAISYFAPVTESVAIVPYIGLQVAGARGWVDENNKTLFGTVAVRDLEEQQLLGYAIGFTLIGNHAIGLNLEQRFANEKAFSLTVGFEY